MGEWDEVDGVQKHLHIQCAQKEKRKIVYDEDAAIGKHLPQVATYSHCCAPSSSATGVCPTRICIAQEKERMRERGGEE